VGTKSVTNYVTKCKPSSSFNYGTAGIPHSLAPH